MTSSGLKWPKLLEATYFWGFLTFTDFSPHVSMASEVIRGQKYKFIEPEDIRGHLRSFKAT